MKTITIEFKLDSGAVRGKGDNVIRFNDFHSDLIWCTNGSFFQVRQVLLEDKGQITYLYPAVEIEHIEIETT